MHTAPRIDEPVPSNRSAFNSVLLEPLKPHWSPLLTFGDLLYLIPQLIFSIYSICFAACPLAFSWPCSRHEHRLVEEASFPEVGNVVWEVWQADRVDVVHVNGEVDLFVHPLVSVR